MTEAARRLTGGPPQAGFVERLRDTFDDDPFTRDVVIDVVADVAFNGRAPRRRPPGASWDRGLTWWAAALAGTTTDEFDVRSAAPDADQHRLFEPATTEPGGEAPPRGRGRRGPSAERIALARTLRELLAASDGDQVPASAIRQLIAQLEQT